MKTWTFSEAKNKVSRDLDLEEENFIQSEEWVGYFNDAIDDAEAEIHKIHEDYFLRKKQLTLVANQREYSLPVDIYANKIRGLVYTNGSLIYPVNRIRNLYKFQEIAFDEQYNAALYYRYILVNNSVETGPKIYFVPAPRAGDESAITMWYLRNARRILEIDEFGNEEEIDYTSVDIANNQLTVSPLVIPYVTGDKVKFRDDSTLPTELTAETTYYVIAVDNTTIKLATSSANATAGTAIDLTTQGSGVHKMQVAGTVAIQNATKLDIPEFTTYLFAYVKWRIAKKERDPEMIADADAEKKAEKKQMVATLTQMVPDNDDYVEADFSFYDEIS